MVQCEAGFLLEWSTQYVRLAMIWRSQFCEPRACHVHLVFMAFCHVPAEAQLLAAFLSGSSLKGD